ncbi:hypothetical protein CFC21_057622 [Triticum aestivum]|uniref:CHCH domain-containing protein n=3 Tax=Triticum TaxID=4564 RepID=A0A9R1AFP1_TRITD|nr:coiled-coil-helix-coiled-coil-helix domain-containing protein 2-like [Triticum aestivum]KAF7048994.1 hypothetical protein CFC21_057622 [Triticum aestivum]VAI26305.1 unnamed protein product [Triticum turgidum subsp. durum]
MGRRSGGGGGGGGFRSAPRPAAPAPKPAAKQSSAPAPAKTDSSSAPTSIFGSIGSAVADGVGWGVGTSMAHRAMDSIMGPRTVRVVEEPAPAADACGIQNQAFSNCIYGNESDISRCQNYFDLLCQCRRGGGAGGAATIA